VKAVTFSRRFANGDRRVAVTISSALATICFINALRQTSVADVLVINATAPFITAALAYAWTADREHWTTLAASLVALVGVVVMISGALASGHLLGDLLALIMTILISAMMVIVRRNRNISMLPAACLSAFLCAVIVAPVSNRSPQRHTISATSRCSARCSSAWPAFAYARTRLVSATRSALIGSLETPLAPAWVWLAVGRSRRSQRSSAGSSSWRILADILLKKSSAAPERVEQAAA